MGPRVITGIGHIWLRTAAAVLALAAIGVALIEPHMPSREEAQRVRAAQFPLPAANPALAGLPPLFADGKGLTGSRDSSLPELIGVAGRLPDDAEALVRIAPGRSRTVRTGQSVLGWTVIAIAADCVTFERDGLQQVARLKPAP